MIHLVLDLPSSIRKRLAAGLESGLLRFDASVDSIHMVVGSNDWDEQILQLLSELNRIEMTGSSAAFVMNLANDLLNARVRPELVWSGPPVPGTFAKNTYQAFGDVLSEASKTLWVSTFAFFDGPRAFASIAKRMDEVPSLRVCLLLNIQRRRGDTSSSESLILRFAERFWKHEWPGDNRPQIYYDPNSLDLDGPGSVLHAKAAIADDTLLLVTSANLTEAAFHRNFELGLLVRDKILGLAATSHFKRLIDRKLLLELPVLG